MIPRRTWLVFAVLIGGLVWGCAGGDLDEACEEGAIAGEYICEDNDWVPHDGPCAGVDCSNRGDCREEDETAVCDCDDGYSADGLECISEDESDPCDGVDCGAQGNCEPDGDNEPGCVCDDGYTAQGLQCVPESSPCDDIDCGPYGECVEQSDNGYQCDCDEDFEWNQDYDICLATEDPCDGAQCEPDGSCELDSNDEPYCDCDDGFVAESLECVPDVQCQGVSDSCSFHILGSSSDAFNEADYADNDLGDELDGPIIAGFGLEDTQRAYLLTESSYFRINTLNFTVEQSGSHGQLHSSLGSFPEIRGAYSIPERHGDSDMQQGDGNDEITFISSQSAPGEHGRALILNYDYDDNSFDKVLETDFSWEQDEMTDNVPPDDATFKAFWLDDENHRGLMSGSTADACADTDGADNFPDSADGLPMVSVMTPDALHYQAAGVGCDPFLTMRGLFESELLTTYDPNSVVTYEDVSAAIWMNQTLYLFTSGYYD